MRLGPYDDLGLLGAGGMGEVRRARDALLGRTMAIKVLRGDLQEDSAAVARFVEEAQVTAQLQHPGIVPVHVLGSLEDGRQFFAMKEVLGRTFDELIAEVHHAAAAGAWRPSPGGWTFRRLVGVLHRACEAVAYAHARGVIHRDLKPQNLMIGDFGEVLVMDWGLAKVLGGPSHEPISLSRSSRDAHLTQLGEIAGTPAYMAPEQATGDHDRVGTTTDVYALGAVLFHILAGYPPFRGSAVYDLLNRVVSGAREALVSPAPVPDALVSLALRAMATNPEERPADARVLAAALAAWLEGDERRAVALARLEKAAALLPDAEALRMRAAELQAESARRLAGLPAHAGAAEKEEAWRLEEEAERLGVDAALCETAYLQTLQSALELDPELPEAHARLAEHYQAQHARAEQLRERASAARLEILLRAHDRGRFAGYLAGQGALTLITDPPGAAAWLYQYTEQGRRLHPVFVQDLGPTPILCRSLPMGSYLVRLRAPGRAMVHYPVSIGREEHWDGVPPGQGKPALIPLPAAGALEPDDCFVPGGWFIAGGDAEDSSSLPRQRIWLDGFVLRRFPVTHRGYLEFLNALVATGRVEEALRMAPRERVSAGREPGTPLYGQGADGRFALRADADGDLWDLDWPVFLVNWHQARAYAAWRAAETGLGWRLPTELEREKAARGVDGRTYPWGDRFDPSFCCMRESHPGRPLPARVDACPADESPYGVRGLAGNVADWCADRFSPGGPATAGGRVAPPDLSPAEGPDFRVVRGNAFSFFHRGSRAARRVSLEAMTHAFTFGFRLARSMG